MRLQVLLLKAAWANGYTGRNFRDSQSLLRYAFGHTAEVAGRSGRLRVGSRRPAVSHWASSRAYAARLSGVPYGPSQKSRR